MLSNVIFDRCRETCWYVVQGQIPVVATTLSQRNDNLPRSNNCVLDSQIGPISVMLFVVVDAREGIFAQGRDPDDGAQQGL